MLSGVVGVAILLVSALFTLGGSLGAPVGVLVANSRARRQGRALSRLASWFAAVFGSSIAMVVIVLFLMALAPPNVLRQALEGGNQARAAQDTVAPPAWVTKLFPQSAQSDSVRKEFGKSKGVFVVTLVIGVAFTCVLFGAIGGSIGWVASALLGYAFSGQRL